MSQSVIFFFFFSSRRRHTRYIGDWSSDVCSSDLQQRWDLGLFQGPHDLVVGLGDGFDGGDEGAGRPGGLAHASMLGVEGRSEERRVGKECRCRWWTKY